MLSIGNPPFSTPNDLGAHHPLIRSTLNAHPQFGTYPNRSRSSIRLPDPLLLQSPSPVLEYLDLLLLMRGELI